MPYIFKPSSDQITRITPYARRLKLSVAGFITEAINDKIAACERADAEASAEQGEAHSGS